jgi:hypothetical protein
MEAAFRYVSPLDEGNVVFQRRDLLPGVSTFSIPGSNVDVIKVTDPLLIAQMGDADAIAIPQFAKEVVFTPTSTARLRQRSNFLMQHLRKFIAGASKASAETRST